MKIGAIDEVHHLSPWENAKFVFMRGRFPLFFFLKDR